jgi:hypothetical protein
MMQSALSLYLAELDASVPQGPDKDGLKRIIAGVVGAAMMPIIARQLQSMQSDEPPELALEAIDEMLEQIMEDVDDFAPPPDGQQS